MRWFVVAPYTAVFLVLIWLTGHRILRAADGNNVKAMVYFGLFVGALVLAAVIVGLLYRAAASTAKGLLAFLEDAHPGQVYAVFKTAGLKEDVSRLTPALQGGSWNARTMYAAVTVDADLVTLWDGSGGKATMVARFDRAAITAAKTVSEPLQIRNAPGLALTIQGASMPVEVTLAPAIAGDFLFLPVSDVSVLKAALTGDVEALRPPL